MNNMYINICLGGAWPIKTMSRKPRACFCVVCLLSSIYFTLSFTGDLVREICSRTPHGVLCFFSSYSLMNKLTKRWQQTGLWRAMGMKKKLFAEPRGGMFDRWIHFRGRLISEHFVCSSMNTSHCGSEQPWIEP